MGNDVKKYALIVNGDTEARHFENVDRALNVLEGEGYETFVASPEKPSAGFDHYSKSGSSDVKSLIKLLKQKIDENDELVIYTTGHGKHDGDVSTICLEDGCDSQELAGLLDSIEYGQRTVVMDQCYGGNLSKIFVDDAKTLFISAGSENEAVCCGDFAPVFWEKNVVDSNGDGELSWQERFAAVVLKGGSTVLPQLVVTAGYAQPGLPPFGNQAVKAHGPKGFEKKLALLEPGQFAIVMFSAKWCDACKVYEPKFEEQAELSGGQHLWIVVESDEVAENYGISSFPSFMIVNGGGGQMILSHLSPEYRLEDAIAEFYSSPADVFEQKLNLAKTIKNSEQLSYAIANMASYIFDSQMGPEGVKCFEDTIALIDKIGDEGWRTTAIEFLTENIANAKLSEDAVPLFEMLLKSISKIKNKEMKTDALATLVIGVTINGVGETELELLHKIGAMAGDIEGHYERAAIFGQIGTGILENSQLKDEALAYIDKAVSEARLIEDNGLRLAYLSMLAGFLGMDGMHEKATEILDGLFADMNEHLDGISYDNIVTISYNMRVSGLGDKSLPYFDLLMGVVSHMESDQTFDALSNIVIDAANSGAGEDAIPEFMNKVDKALVSLVDSDKINHKVYALVMGLKSAGNEKAAEIFIREHLRNSVGSAGNGVKASEIISYMAFVVADLAVTTDYGGFSAETISNIYGDLVGEAAGINSKADRLTALKMIVDSMGNIKLLRDGKYFSSVANTIISEIDRIEDPVIRAELLIELAPYKRSDDIYDKTIAAIGSIENEETRSEYIKKAALLLNSPQYSVPLMEKLIQLAEGIENDEFKEDALFFIVIRITMGLEGEETLALLEQVTGVAKTIKNKKIRKNLLKFIKQFKAGLK